MNKKLTKRMLATGLLISGAMISGVTATATAKEDANEVREVSTFTAISLHGSMDMVVEAGKKQRVEIFADARDIEFIKTEVKGGELRVKVEKHHHLRDGVRLSITVQDLNEVSVNGSGDIVASGVDSDDFDAEVNGSGDIDLSGKCIQGEYEINGSGDIDAVDMKCETVSIEINGSGDMAISASEYFSVDINGSGDVDVYGEPRLRKLSSNGSGDVNMRN